LKEHPNLEKDLIIDRVALKKVGVSQENITEEIMVIRFGITTKSTYLTLSK
jgi:hypothetical protein